jgi:hypothetical protein
MAYMDRRRLTPRSSVALAVTGICIGPVRRQLLGRGGVFPRGGPCAARRLRPAVRPLKHGASRRARRRALRCFHAQPDFRRSSRIGPLASGQEFRPSAPNGPAPTQAEVDAAIQKGAAILVDLQETYDDSGNPALARGSIRDRRPTMRASRTMKKFAVGFAASDGLRPPSGLTRACIEKRASFLPATA